MNDPFVLAHEVSSCASSAVSPGNPNIILKKTRNAKIRR